MYYLLDNNKIIDTNDTTFKHHYTLPNGVSYYSIETPNETHYHYTFGDYEWNDNVYEFYSYQVKKQSNNIYDLVEEGDVVRYWNHLFEVVEGKNIKFRDASGDLCYFSILDKRINEYISKIYKPNAKGGFDLVWECEE